MLLCCVCVNVSERLNWVGVMVTTHLFGFGEEHKMPTACLLQRLSSLLCTLTHTSPAFDHLHINQCLIYLFINFVFDDGDNSCMPEGLPLCTLFVNRILNLCHCNLCILHMSLLD